MKPFRVALCQLQAHDLSDAEMAYQDIAAALQAAGEAGANLVCLPECSYPAYYLGDSDPYARPGVRPYAEVLELLAAAAKEHGYWIAAGFAVPHESGALTNSGVVIGPDGETRGQYDKSFLWHFDSTWFARGTSFPVFETEFAKFGILICADGRIPEIARMLTLAGAEVIVDLTAWVSGGPSVSQLMNVQCEYMMPVRAYENGAWVVAADKWGTEDGTIIYAGRSSVFDPKGVTRFCGPSDSGGVLTFDLEPMHGDPVQRRPSLYTTLTAPSESLPVMALLEEAIVPAKEERRIAVVPGSDDFLPRVIIEQYRAQRRQGTDLVVLPGMIAAEGWQVYLAEIEAAVKEDGGALVFGVDAGACSRWRSAVVVTPEGAVEHVGSHGRGLYLGETNAPVVKTCAGNVGIICGDEMFVPEVARGLALNGAEYLAWPMWDAHPHGIRTARTRSDENGVYVAAAWPGGGAITAPSGTLVTQVPEGATVAMAAQVNRAFARMKVRAPGTNVMRDRQPELYGSLTARSS